jgi:hypothetical protein
LRGSQEWLGLIQSNAVTPSQQTDQKLVAVCKKAFTRLAYGQYLRRFQIAPDVEDQIP